MKNEWFDVGFMSETVKPYETYVGKIGRYHEAITVTFLEITVFPERKEFHIIYIVNGKLLEATHVLYGSWDSTFNTHFKLIA